MPQKIIALRNVLILLVAACLTAAALAYLSAGFIGYPDGFRSDTDRSRKLLLQAFAALSLFWALGFGFLARQSFRQLGAASPFRVATSLLALVYALLCAGTWLWNNHLAKLSSQGG